MDKKYNLDFFKRLAISKNGECLSTEYIICIEYDGEQHYKPINFNGCSNEQAQKIYLELIKNDEIKNKYCLDNNIQLIRIPYTVKNIEEHLNNKLQSILVFN